MGGHRPQEQFGGVDYMQSFGFQPEQSYTSGFEDTQSIQQQNQATPIAAFKTSQIETYKKEIKLHSKKQ